MDMEGLSLICASLGTVEEDDQGNRIGYVKGEYCLDNLKDLLRFLRRDDPQTRDAFKQVCKWNKVSKDLIPIIEYYQEDRNLLLNAVKVLVFLTMPIEPGSTDIQQQLEYLWGLKSALTSSDVVAVVVSFLERPLENLEHDAFTEDDWKLVQLLLTLFRNILAVQEIPLQQSSAGFATEFLSVRDKFLELLFRENVMDILLVISQYVGGSSVYLQQDNLLLLEIFHYIFFGQDPVLIVKTHLHGAKVEENSQASLSSLQSIMEEEKKKKSICSLNNFSRHSQFSGTFSRLTMDGSKAVLKGNPNSSLNVMLKSKNITRAHAKKIAWDHPRFPPTKDKILELLQAFISQFLSGGYNVLMRSIREDIEKEHPAIQKSDVVVFFQVAEFVTSFQFHKYSASKSKEGGDTFETLGDKDVYSSDFNGQICGPIAASLNEAMFQLVISKWRQAYEGLKETNDYKFLSAAGSLLKNMIRMLDLVLKLFPEDSKEPQTARILLYKLFYDQTEEGMTRFLLNLIKTFDNHKQPKSDLADLVEIIHKVVKLMDNLQSRGALRVSKKSKKIRKKKLPEVIESADKQIEEHSSMQNEDGICIGNESAESQPLQKDNPSNANPPGEEGIVVPDDSEHENVVEEFGNLDSLEPTENKNPKHANEDELDENVDSSDEEQLNTICEVDFKVSTLVATFANHNIIQKLCWLLKFYKSNSLATNHYIISMLRRISDDLELHAMFYQLSLLTTFYDILVEQKSCPCNEYADIVDFLNSLVRKMLKKMKKQPLLFVEILFWKTRRECHYINAEYLLDELGHLRKESRNWGSTQGDGEVGSSAAKVWTRRSIADALGDDEADVLITHEFGYQNNEEMLDDVIEGFVSTFGSKDGKDDNSEEKMLEDESQIAPRRKKKLILDGELEEQIKELFQKFKDDPQCSCRIAEALDQHGKISAAQIFNKLKKLGLKVRPKRKMRNSDEPSSTRPNVQKRKRVHAFSEDQEAQIRVLYEQFKDHRRCSFMIANSLDLAGKFTPAQVSRKLKQLGLSFPQKKSSGGEMLENGADLVDGSKDRMEESDDEKLISLIPRKKMKNVKVSIEQLHEQTSKDSLSKDDSDDEMLISVRKKKMKNVKVSIEQLHEQTSKDSLSKDDSDDEMLSSVRKKKMKNVKVSIEQLHEQTSKDSLSKDDSDDEMLSSVRKKKMKIGQECNHVLLPMKTRRSLLASKRDDLESIQIEERTMDSDSSHGDCKDLSESGERVDLINSDKVEYHQVDPELVDSEDEVVVGAPPDNTVSRRMLRMVIDHEDDD
ncbi:uncharacterized protein LOC107466801 [Arachis duranensis]|uniref:Uncharacterized protein LOC107466801 n=1 Tax=Arachis duranensis TaxID=130453 RepID=A0A9C6TL59_ARADU|nr:uncharacterized protein LOC107466801 [Arachis duranensis]